MKTTKKCAFCGRTFTSNSGMQKYCCVRCADEAKKERKKRNDDFLKAANPVIGLREQEYLTFSKAAILMGCSRQYVYKLVSQGKLKASRISSRMAIIRRADIESMLEGSPYNKVVFGSRPKPSILKQRQKKPETVPVSGEPLTYLSGEEVMSIYKVKQMWLYTTAKRNQIPMCRIAGKNYYSKSHVEECLGLTVDTSTITEWLTTDEVFEEFGMKPTAHSCLRIPPQHSHEEGIRHHLLIQRLILQNCDRWTWWQTNAIVPWNMCQRNTDCPKQTSTISPKFMA